MKKYVVAFLLCVASMASAQNQNKYEETIPYGEWNGEIVIPVKVASRTYSFLYRVQAATAVLKDRFAALGVTNNVIPALNIGTTLFADRVKVQPIDRITASSANPDIVGIIGKDVFADYVVSIDRQAKALILSTPFKPAYVELKNRVLLRNLAFDLPLTETQTLQVNVGPVGEAFLYASPTDYAKLKPLLRDGKLPTVKFVKKMLTNCAVVEDKAATASRLGGEVLNYGILSIDYSKNRMYFQPYDELNAALRQQTSKAAGTAHANLIPIDRTVFNAKVFNYRAGKKWDYLGDKPAIIDFWATWCGPCKKMLPAIEKLAAKYHDQIYFYKLDVDEEKEIAKYYGIVSIPVLMFIPAKGKATSVVGLRTEQELEALIQQLLK